MDVFTNLRFFLSMAFLSSIVISKGHFSAKEGVGMMEVGFVLMGGGSGIRTAEIGFIKSGGSVGLFDWGVVFLDKSVVVSRRDAVADDWPTAVVFVGLRRHTVNG